MRGGAGGMGAAAAASAAAVGQMSGLSSSADKAASAVATAAAAMQFPLTQRRKRRVLFTQAQVSSKVFYGKVPLRFKNSKISFKLRIRY